MDTTTRPAPLAPIQGCEPDEDFGLCDICDITKWDDTTSCAESGTVVCSDCERAEWEEMARLAPSFPSLDQIRRDCEDTLDAMGAGSDEGIKALTLLNSL